MKRDLNLCRDLLLYLEKGKSLKEYGIPYKHHAKLLYDADLVDGHYDNDYSLTMKGHDVVSLIRDKDTWDYIMSVSDEVGGLPFDMILEWSKESLARKVDEVVKDKEAAETQNLDNSLGSFQPYIDAVNKIATIFNSTKSDTTPFLPSSSYDEPLGIDLINIEKLVYINKDYQVALLELMKYVQREGNLYIIGEHHKSRFVNDLLRTILKEYDKTLSNDDILLHEDLVHVYKLIEHNQFKSALSELNRYMVKTGYIKEVYEMPNSLAKSVLSLHNLILENLNNLQVVQNKEAVDDDSGFVKKELQFTPASDERFAADNVGYAIADAYLLAKEELYHSALLKLNSYIGNGGFSNNTIELWDYCADEVKLLLDHILDKLA